MDQAEVHGSVKANHCNLVKVVLMCALYLIMCFMRIFELEDPDMADQCFCENFVAFLPKRFFFPLEPFISYCGIILFYIFLKTVW